MKAVFTHGSDGEKLSVKSGNNGFEYLGSLIYVRRSGKLSFEQVLFDEGAVKSSGPEYWLRDHLGSVRVIVNKAGKILEQNDYYPFGGRHGNSSLAISSTNRYKFSGKESLEPFDIGLLDFGARYYDLRIARWSTQDPMAENYLALSPYGYCSGNPVSRIDPSGMADDWVERFDEKQNKMRLVFDPNVTSAGDPDLKEGDRYLGKAVVVFEGSRNEKLGKGDNLFGEGANLAKVTVYGPKGEDDIKTYDGYTMSSDPSKYGVVADGEYDVNRLKPGERKGPYDSDLTVNGRGKVPAMDNFNPAYPGRDPAYLEGVFLHRSNNNGWAGRKWDSEKNVWVVVSKGCLLVLPNQWNTFYKQLDNVNNFKVQVTRKP